MALTLKMLRGACRPVPSFLFSSFVQKVPILRLRHGHPRFQYATAAASVVQPKKVRTSRMENEEELSFDLLKDKISYPTLQAITVKPFQLKTMTAVQANVLPQLPELIRPYDPNEQKGDLPSRDLMVKARTGTGKTLAFLVPAIEARLQAIERAGMDAVQEAGLVTEKHLEGRARRVFSRTNVGTLIISPTRELATQIANEAIRLSYHHREFEVRLFTGGSSRRAQMRDFMKGRRDIIVATPGRLLDLASSEPEVKAGLATTRMLILDEADTLLDMGFRQDIDEILKFLPPSPERQTFMFSATISPAIRQIARSTLSPGFTSIDTVGPDDVPVHARIPQFHTVVPSPADQIPHVLRLIAHDQLANPGKSKVIVFLPTTKMTQLFATLLRELKTSALPGQNLTNVYELHSKRANDSRIATSDQFRNDKSGVSVLVTSDVSARGVDYPGVTRVIQVGIPGATEQYVHRIGRTGRGSTASGRGDLVLLPWEIGFVTWQLTDIPLKPITVNELKSQVLTLAEKYDENPQVAISGEEEKPSHFKRGGRDSRQVSRLKPIGMLPKDQKAIAESINAAVESLLPTLDEEAIKETFASLLGYYMSKSPELRVQKSVIVEGCKEWTTGACGLSVPPYVSVAFLEKLGFSDGRTKRFGHAYENRKSQYDVRTTPWSGRGQHRLRDRERAEPKYVQYDGAEVDPDDPVSDPSEFKTKRYTRQFQHGRPMNNEDSPRNQFRSSRPGDFRPRDSRPRDGENEWRPRMPEPGMRDRDRGGSFNRNNRQDRAGGYGTRR